MTTLVGQNADFMRGYAVRKLEYVGLRCHVLHRMFVMNMRWRNDAFIWTDSPIVHVCGHWTSPSTNGHGSQDPTIPPLDLT